MDDLTIILIIVVVIAVVGIGTAVVFAVRMCINRDP